MKANITQSMIDAISKKQIEVLDAWWEEHSTEAMREQAKGKTMKGALAFIRSVAQTVAQNGMAMISDEDTYGLLVHYMADEPEGAIYTKYEQPKPKAEQPKPKAKAKAAEKTTPAAVVAQTAKEAARAALAEEVKHKVEQMFFNF